MTALAQPGHQPPVAVTSKFLVPGGIEWLVFGDQVDRENFRTRPSPAIQEFALKRTLVLGAVHHIGYSVAPEMLGG
jgi:hypothetical protein